MNKFNAGKLYSFINPHKLKYFYYQSDPRIDMHENSTEGYISINDMECVLMLEFFCYKNSNYIKFLAPSGLICFTIIGSQHNFGSYFKEVVES